MSWLRLSLWQTQHLTFFGQVVKEKDTDGDGELSFQEYVGDRGQGKDKEWLISEKERLVNYFFEGVGLVFIHLCSDLILSWTRMAMPA